MRLVPLVVVLVLAGLAGCTDAPAPAPTPPPTSGAVSVSPTAPPDDAVARLLARPLSLPLVAPGTRCPVTPPRTHSPVSQPGNARGPGRGPLYPLTTYLNEDSTIRLAPFHSQAPNGLYELKVVWASTTGMYEGPAIVRLGRLDGPGHGYVRDQYDATAARGDAVVFEVTDYPRDWPSQTFVSGPGCYAYQVDGLTYTEVIIFRVLP